MPEVRVVKTHFAKTVAAASFFGATAGACAAAGDVADADVGFDMVEVMSRHGV